MGATHRIAHGHDVPHAHLQILTWPMALAAPYPSNPMMVAFRAFSMEMVIELPCKTWSELSVNTNVLFQTPRAYNSRATIMQASERNCTLMRSWIRS